jgi:hypothetical protein
MIDLDDEELYEEGQETKVRELMRRWMDERLSPDLLPWHGELVAEMLEMLQSQVKHFMSPCEDFTIPSIERHCSAITE